MSSSYQDRYDKILKDYLSTELYLACRDRGISDETMMKWYHVLGRDQKLLQIRVKDALNDTKELYRSTEKMKENLKKQLERYNEIQKQSVEDKVYQK